MRAQQKQERGATAVVVALLLTVIGGFLALGMNVGHMMSVRGQLQNRVDAAALAGAMSFNRTQEGFATAHQMAQDYAERHLTDIEFVPMDLNLGNDAQGDIVHGIWHFDRSSESAFEPATAGTNPTLVNALHVRSGREQSRGNPLQVFFDVFLGQETASVTAEAIAVGGAPCEGCVVPIVFAECLIRQADGSLNCGVDLRFSNDQNDNIGFTNLQDGVSAVNPPTVKEILDSGCAQTQVGDNIGVQNGNDFNPVVDAFERYVNRNGNELTAPVVRPDTCPSPRFNQLQPVVGFATFTVLEFINDRGEKGMTIRFECDEEIQQNVPGGCGPNYGTTAPLTHLVR